MSRGQEDQQAHRLKLSLDCYSTKNLAFALNCSLQYSLALASAQKHFKSSQATPISQGPQETRIDSGFAAYEFVATKAQLLQIVAQNSRVEIRVSDGSKQVAAVHVDLKELFSAPLKQSATTMVRVSD